MYTKFTNTHTHTHYIIIMMMMIIITISRGCHKLIVRTVLEKLYLLLQLLTKKAVMVVEEMIRERERERHTRGENRDEETLGQKITTFHHQH